MKEQHSIGLIIGLIFALSADADPQLQLPSFECGFAGAVAVTDFGARPNQPSFDNFDALQRAADYLSSDEGMGKTLFFPMGTYYIRRVRSSDQEPYGIRYRNIWGSEIVGCGSTLDVRGDLARGVNRYPQQISAFVFEDSYAFTLRDFTIDGHVDQMTRSHRDDGLSYGIMTQTQAPIQCQM